MTPRMPSGFIQMAHCLMLTLLFIFPVNVMPGVAQNRNNTGGDSRIWDVVVATCDDPGSGTDASAYLKIYYEAGHESQTFFMDKPGRDDFEQGSRDHFRLLLKQSDIVNMGLYWWPGFSLSQSWCVEWVALIVEMETCYEGIFKKWILHYRH